MCQTPPPRGEQAVSDARVEGPGVPNAFSEAFGIKISKETTPEIFKLVVMTVAGIGSIAIGFGKPKSQRHSNQYFVCRDILQHSQRVYQVFQNL